MMYAQFPMFHLHNLWSFIFDKFLKLYFVSITPKWEIILVLLKIHRKNGVIAPYKTKKYASEGRRSSQA